MNNLSNKKYPSNQYLTEIVSDIKFAEMTSVEAVRVMARELLAYREAQGKVYAFTTEAEMLHVRHGSNGYIMNVSRIGDFSDAIPLYTAPQIPAVPVWFVLVPIEPTQEMLDSGECYIEDGFSELDKAYKAMLAAAPKPGIDNVTDNTAQQFESLSKRSADE